MSENKNWVPCDKPSVNDVLRWTEPMWAKPKKARGKRDKTGEQQVVAKLTAKGRDLFELTVISVKKLSGHGYVIMNEGDEIRRKKTSLDMGECHKQTCS